MLSNPGRGALAGPAPLVGAMGRFGRRAQEDDVVLCRSEEFRECSWTPGKHQLRKSILDGLYSMNSSKTLF